METLALALMLSLDNVRLATGLGLLEMDRRRWWQLICVMAAAEAGFPLIGVGLGIRAPVPDLAAEYLGPGLLIVAALFTLAGLFAHRSRPSPKLLYLLPVVFGLDNLLAGAGLGVGASSLWLPVLMIAAVSGLVSLITMFAVGMAVAPLRTRWAVLPAAAALLVGSSFLLTGGS